MLIDELNEIIIAAWRHNDAENAERLEVILDALMAIEYPNN